jgi:hypothetical protein
MAWHKNLHTWIGEYLQQSLKRLSKPRPHLDNIHVMFCVTDHYEPYVLKVNDAIAKERVLKWVNKLPLLARRHTDSYGNNYRHNFFYPAEEYRPELLGYLADLCRAGFGETEIHLHHDNDTPDNLQTTLLDFKDTLSNKHELLSKEKQGGEIKFGFIHGNWALDNSHPSGKHCGVNCELKILDETGCYADFTMPSAPDITQTNKINSIYYAVDDPDHPKSHNDGYNVRIGGTKNGNLLLVQGPLTLDWNARKRGIFPGIENGELGGGRPPTLYRFKLWLQQQITVAGKPDWLFIKVHTHGALEKNAAVLLGKEMDNFLTSLKLFFSSSNNLHLHYVSAREMYNIIKAAEAGESGDPEEYRNYSIVSLMDATK